MHDPQHTLNEAVDRASEITWWNRRMTKLNEIPNLDNAYDFVETDLVERKGPYLELVKAPQAASEPASEFLDSLEYHDDITNAVVSELFDGDDSGSLYQHQAETIEAIERTNNDTILSVPTATGKTESFFFPILNHCLSTDEEGLKSLVIYPMKTLSVDQLNRFLTYLDHINRDRDPKDRITIGIWDGDTPHDVGSKDYEIEVDSFIRGLECPRTKEKLRVRSSTTVGTEKTEYSWIRVTRESIRQGVDILLTNPEALDYMLVNDSADTRSILGSRPGEHPLKHIVYDEAHVWSGISGAAISLLTKRLKHFYGNRDPQVTMVSATVDNPTELASSLTHTSEDNINAVDFTSREVPVKGTPDFTRFDPCTLDELVETIARTTLTADSSEELLSQNPNLEGALGTLREVSLVQDTSAGLSISEIHADWVCRPVQRIVDQLVTEGAYDTERAVLDDQDGLEQVVEAVVKSGGSSSQWYEFVIDSVPEVATFAAWFDTDTTGSVGFKKQPQLIESVAREGAENPREILETVMHFGRMAGIVTEKYHAFLKPPLKVHWCQDCHLVSRSNACRECGEEIPELQFCRRCHYPFVERGESTEDDDETDFVPIGTSEVVSHCPGCDKYVNLTDIEVPTSTLLSFMLTEICRTAPSKKTLVFSDSHASAESVGGEIIGQEYGLMAESLYVKELLDHDGAHDNYEIFKTVSEQLREAYYNPLFQNEIDEDSETYNILRQLRNDISQNAYLSNCRHLLESALVLPEPLYQATTDDLDRRVIATELYKLFALEPRVGFSKETVDIEGLTREKIVSRIGNRTTLSESAIADHVDEFLQILLDDRVITEQSWERIQQAVSEGDVGTERQDKVFDYIEAQRARVNDSGAFTRSFDSGVFTRIPKQDESSLRLIPRVSYCTECFSTHPVPEGLEADTCRSCGAAVETYDRYEIKPDGSYEGQGYADVDSDWQWPVDHWAYELNRPLEESEDGTPEFVTVGIHKGNIPPTLRGAIEESFRKDDPDVNIVSATPTMELGVDIGTLDTVTQVGIPPNLTNYVQRSGRTGRTRGSSSLVMTVVRGDHPVDNHYYANLEGFFRNFEPVRVPDPFEFDELLAGHVMTTVIAYLARNPHESNIFSQIYELETKNTDLQKYVSEVTERLNILREFILEEKRSELTNYIREVFGEEGVRVFERIFVEDGNLSLQHRADFTFQKLTAMSGSTETNKRLSERHNRLDSWLSLLGYLANYRDFGQQFPVKFSGRQDSIEFESSGRLYDMFPGEENALGSVLSLHGTQYVVSDVHGTTTPISEVAVCINEDCDRPFQAYQTDTEHCPHCEEPLAETNIHGVGSVECRTTRGGEEGYHTRGILSTHIAPSEGGDEVTVDERTLFGVQCPVEYGEYAVTDFVYAFERGHSRSPDRTTLRSEALIEREKGGSSEGLSWEERLEDVSKETYAPVGQRYHTQGLKLNLPRSELEERLSEALPDETDWPQAIASFEQALTKAVAIVGEFDQQDFRIKTVLKPETVEVYLVDGRQGGNGITWRIRQELEDDLLSAIAEVAACERCADFCEECLLLSRTPPAYLENDLLNKYTLRAFLGDSTMALTDGGD
ncbi:Distinct helicase family with a unique C-terminal domain including a metal-binding cysteine cluster [Halapricum desulfuricans]|uniref:Distinct helicase family with a unique C-terminal domain including a metal-binding cysteine cluster n=2 Tax=Halapricum desulfuricans TaxID=2841257 RepID=A0A897NMR2_9EURY|nr:Distinct helicase family with a unique C-terminal domain including a metal-binding cysteine cluster [Halapricum desulfuricans]